MHMAALARQQGIIFYGLAGGRAYELQVCFKIRLIFERKRKRAAGDERLPLIADGPYSRRVRKPEIEDDMFVRGSQPGCSLCLRRKDDGQDHDQDREMSHVRI